MFEYGGKMRQVSWFATGTITLMMLGCGGGQSPATETGSDTGTGTGTTTEGTDSTGTASDSSSSDSTAGSESNSETGTVTTDPTTEGPTTEEPTTEEPTTETTEGSCLGGMGNFEFDVEVIPSNVVLIVDKSGSMVNPDNNWDHDGDDADDDGFNDEIPNQMATPKVSRWFSVHGTVNSIAATFEATMKIGVQLFPSVDAITVLGAEACLVDSPPEVPAELFNTQTILNTIPAADDTSMEGATPMREAVISAHDYLGSLEMSGADAMILITDGAPNCSPDAETDMDLLYYDEGVVTAVANAHADGVTTFVVGVDIKNEVDNNGINPYEVCNDLAVAGGTPLEGVEKFYNTQNQNELTQALEGISGQLVDCTLHLDEPPPADVLIEVTVDNVEFGEVVDCDNGNGWQLSPDMLDLELCGEACTAFQQNGAANINYVCE